MGSTLHLQSIILQTIRALASILKFAQQHELCLRDPIAKKLPSFLVSTRITRHWLRTKKTRQKNHPKSARLWGSIFRGVRQLGFMLYLVVVCSTPRRFRMNFEAKRYFHSYLKFYKTNLHIKAYIAFYFLAILESFKKKKRVGADVCKPNVLFKKWPNVL